MIIGIDGNEANIAHRVGSGQYAFNLLQNLSLLDKKNTYYIYLKNPPAADLPKESSNWHYKILKPSALWTKVALSFHLLLNPEKLDLFFSPGHYLPLFSSVKLIPTIHDIGYLKFQDQFTKKDLYQLTNWTQASLKIAHHIVAVSQFTKKELIKTYQIPAKKISVIYNGISLPKAVSPQDKKATLSKFKIKQKYFLAVGTLKPNKNYSFLISAFAQFLKKHPHTQLVIAGKKGWLFADIAQTVEKFKLNSQVIFTDYISEVEKNALYQQAWALVLPSTYEGFGIPAIEAQIQKCPVIASSIAPLKEVLQDTALLINPYKQATLVSAFEKILDTKTRRHLIKVGFDNASKFTWKNSAQNLISLFNRL